ncbi:MAG: glycogen/starch synthase [Abditibacteriota bacterium]|nr:glycogen/starch synthase [Abditibacteriota bacterium]
MKILFVVGECLPYIKTGGLADVIRCCVFKNQKGQILSIFYKK